MKLTARYSTTSPYKHAQLPIIIIIIIKG